MWRRKNLLVCCLVLGLGLRSSATAAEPPGEFQRLAERVGRGQPVYAEAEDGTVLVSQAAALPVHPASVSKVATSLALLSQLGLDYRFQTRLSHSGELRDGRIQGDLVLEAGRDPFLVFESIFLILQGLQEQRVKRVTGGLSVRGPLLFNWQPDTDGSRVRQVLAGKVGREAWSKVVDDPASSLARAALEFDGNSHDVPAESGRPHPILSYESPPLLHIVKVLNGYSNNVFHLVSDEIGGPRAVEATARKVVPAGLGEEIVLTNGAGAGTTNRMSARAAVAILRALDGFLAGKGRQLFDVLPVSGVDPGTLDERFPENPRLVVGKTGTYGDVGASALAGVLRTERFGKVYFAVLNSFVPVPEARERQDTFVRGLASEVEAKPWPYERATRPDYRAARVRGASS